MKKADEYPKVGDVIICPECGSPIAKRTGHMSYDIAKHHNGNQLLSVPVEHGTGIISLGCPRGCDYRYKAVGVIERLGISEETVAE